MSNRRILQILTFLSIFFFSSSVVLFAYDDGFGGARRIEGKHFVVYIEPSLDLSSLLRELNVSPSEEILVGTSKEKDSSHESELLNMLDTLFLQICDILDMQLYNFQSNIKICRDRAQLNKIYRNLFGKDLNASSFYMYSFNSIYISADSFNLGILGHEMAHSVISRYFVVLPPVKIQEVLATYVEYQLRRAP